MGIGCLKEVVVKKKELTKKKGIVINFCRRKQKNWELGKCLGKEKGM